MRANFLDRDTIYPGDAAAFRVRQLPESTRQKCSIE